MSRPYDNTPERTFAALPPAHGRGFAQTWWGQAWLKALEDENAKLKKLLAETMLDNAILKCVSACKFDPLSGVIGVQH